MTVVRVMMTMMKTMMTMMMLDLAKRLQNYWLPK